MSTLHIDNHYVPQLYLKQWASSGKVLTHSLLVQHERVQPWKRHSTKGIAYRQHLYTSIVNGQESDALERWLDSEFEAPAEAAIRLVVTGGRLDSDHWKRLVRFALAQDVRTPARLRQFLHRQGQELPVLLHDVAARAVTRLENGNLPKMTREAETGHGIPIRMDIEDAGDGEHPRLKIETIVGRSMWHWAIRHLLTHTAEKISMKGWAILRPALGEMWPTSDNPLIRLNFFGNGRYNFEGGWQTPKGDVLLPLSPQHLLHRCHGMRPPPRGSRLDTETTRAIQRIIVEHADRFVFSESQFDIESIRERCVDPNAIRAERQMWARWHKEQTEAERGYSKG